MIDNNTFKTYPELKELIKYFQELIAKCCCPPEFEIWSNKRFRKELEISERKASYLRSSGQIEYSKIDGLIFYLKSDVLEMMYRNKVNKSKSKIRIPIYGANMKRGSNPIFHSKKSEKLFSDQSGIFSSDFHTPDFLIGNKDMSGFSSRNLNKPLNTTINYDNFKTYPDLIEVVKYIEELISIGCCPPEFEFWSNRRLCKELEISERKAAYLRSKEHIDFIKIDGLLYYLKSDVLKMIHRNKVKKSKPKSRIH